MLGFISLNKLDGMYSPVMFIVKFVSIVRMSGFGHVADVNGGQEMYTE